MTIRRVGIASAFAILTAVGLVGVAGLIAVAAARFVADEGSDAPGPPPIVAPGGDYALPLVVTEGGTYTGQWESTEVETPAVLVATQEAVVIEDCAVRGPGDLIAVEVGTRADVTIRGCYGEGTDASSQSRFVVFDSGWVRAVVENNDLVRTAGMWFHDASPVEARVEGNRVREITTGGTDYVQFVQFDKVEGPFVVAWNEVVNTPRSSRVEDVINLFSSGGSSTSELARIHDNFIWGAYPDPLDSEYSGGGIMVGDGDDDGSDVGNVAVERNQVVATTNYGISVVCGHSQLVRGNTIVASGRTADGERIPATNVGLSMGSSASWGSMCDTYDDNDATGNDLGWQRGDGSRNDAWTPDCDRCGGNGTRDGLVTVTAERAEWVRWLAKSQGRRIGRGPA
jgi:hypothetical protein